MIAVAIGSVILLLSLVAVRTGTDALRRINQQSDINDGLRSGWQAAIDEVDFWRSHQASYFPYGRSFMAQGEEAIAGGAIDRKRLFRERLAGPANAQAGMLDPSSLGAYAWQGLLPAVVGFPVARLPDSGNVNHVDLWYKEDYDNWKNLLGDSSTYDDPSYNSTQWRIMSAVVEGPDPLTSYTLHAADMFDMTQEGMDYMLGHSNAVYNGPFFLPAGWDPWHVMGDWPAISNWQALNIPGHAADEPHLQAIQMDAYRNLGHIGVSSYAPPGTPNAIADPVDPTNPRRSRGIPGALIGAPINPLDTIAPLTVGEGAAAYTLDLDDIREFYVAGLPGVNYEVSLPPLPTDSRVYGTGRHDSYKKRKNRNLLNFFSDHPATGDGFTAPAYNNTTPATNLWSSNLPFILADYDRTVGWSAGTRGNRPSSPHGFFYANRIVPGLGTRAMTDYLDDWYADPQRMFWDHDTFLNNELASLRGRRMAPLLERHTTWIAQVAPAAIDAAFDPDRLDGDHSYMLRTGIVRWRMSGRDRAVALIHLGGAPGDPAFRFNIPMLGTTFQGARLLYGRD